MSKHKLELVWVGKEKRARLEPRILIEDPAKSYHAAKRVSKDDIFDNMLIHGDNLLALKALEQEYAGKVKCIYIDPPYNTGNAFEHYDDGLEHSIWLSLMRDRLEILRNLLSDDGSIFVHLDDNESDYFKVLMDEYIGRRNFVSRITIDVRAPSAFSTVNPGVFKASEYILWYAKDKSKWESKSLRISSTRNEAYNIFIINKSENYENWKFIPLKKAFLLKLNSSKVNLICRFF